MAQNNTKVLLGFEDELITEKHKNQINFTTNKIGGKPVSSDITPTQDKANFVFSVAKSFTTCFS
jgi:hypothetical protein